MWRSWFLELGDIAGTAAMAPAATPLILDTEGHGSTVTCATELTLFHVFHLELFPGHPRNDQTVVTVSTVVTLGKMQFMAEQYTPGTVRQLVFHCFGHVMALVTAAGD